MWSQGCGGALEACLKGIKRDEVGGGGRTHQVALGDASLEIRAESSYGSPKQLPCTPVAVLNRCHISKNLLNWISVLLSHGMKQMRRGEHLEGFQVTSLLETVQNFNLCD